MFKKISELNETTETVDEDVFPVVNSGETKKLKMSSLVNYLKTALGSVFANRNHSHGKADITDFPTKLSQFQNDAGYVNKDSDNLENYTKTSDLADVALSGSYDDLDGKPTIPDISGKEDRSNKVSELNENSTNDQYPGAKAVYEELQTLYSALPTATATGETIHIEDSSNLPIKDFKLKNGIKNLLNRTTCTENTILIWTTGINYSSDKGLASDYIPVKPSEQLKFNYNAQVMFYDNSKTYLGCLQEGGTTIAKVTGKYFNTLTVPNNADIKYMRLGFATFANASADMTAVDIMVNVGTELEPYEPYGVVTGDNMVKVVEKNIFSGNWSQFDNKGGEGSLYAYFKLPKENVTYTLTMIAKNDFTPNGNTFLGFTTAGGQTSGSGSFYWLVSGSMSMIPAGTVLTYSTNSKSFISMYSKTVATLKNFTDNFDIILEESPSYTSYEPYTEQTQLLSLGDTQLAPTDEIAKVNNEWCVNDTHITDTTLTGQLDNLLKMNMNKPITNIFFTTENATPTGEVTYYIDLNTLVNTTPATLSTNSLNTNLLMNPSSLTNIDDNNDETI